MENVNIDIHHRNGTQYLCIHNLDRDHKLIEPELLIVPISADTLHMGPGMQAICLGVTLQLSNKMEGAKK